MSFEHLYVFHTTSHILLYRNNSSLPVQEQHNFKHIVWRICFLLRVLHQASDNKLVTRNAASTTCMMAITCKRRPVTRSWQEMHCSINHHVTQRFVIYSALLSEDRIQNKERPSENEWLFSRYNNKASYCQISTKQKLWSIIDVDDWRFRLYRSPASLMTQMDSYN